MEKLRIPCAYKKQVIWKSCGLLAAILHESILSTIRLTRVTLLHNCKYVDNTGGLYSYNSCCINAMTYTWIGRGLLPAALKFMVVIIIVYSEQISGIREVILINNNSLFIILLYMVTNLWLNLIKSLSIFIQTA